MIGHLDNKEDIKGSVSSKPVLKGEIEKENNLTGFIIQRPLISSIETSKKELEGKLNIGVREIGSFSPYVLDEILCFKSQASVDGSELIISG